MSHKFVAALHYTWLDKFYDPMIRLTMPEVQFKRDLIEAAEISPPARILDLGCGTGTFCLMIKKTYPDLEVFGIDPDQEILKLAKKKAQNKSLEITFVRSVSAKLPFPDGTFQNVFSTLVFHHLKKEEKLLTLNEIKRVLKNNGSFLIADFGAPQNMLMSFVGEAIRRFDSLATTEDNFKGRLPQMFHQTKFQNLVELKYCNTIFGTVRLYKMQKKSDLSSSVED